ncbi:MAG TPA: hypothetical protein VHZ03_42985 [Trebonia sp.]|nr:hypothetical protein [Trebonia sp.]
MTRTDPASAPNSARAGYPATPVRQLLEALNWAPAQIGSSALRWTVNVLAWVGAIGVLLSGLIHLKLWINGGYQGISVIGPLFLAQGIAGILLAAALGVFRRLWLVLAGAGYCVATAAGLLISVNFGLFGFKDSLLVPYATASLVEEFIGGGVLLVAAIVFLAGRPWRARSERVWPPPQ